MILQRESDIFPSGEGTGHSSFENFTMEVILALQTKK